VGGVDEKFKIIYLFYTLLLTFLFQNPLQNQKALIILVVPSYGYLMYSTCVLVIGFFKKLSITFCAVSN
jgi:hypothetical protein